MTRDSYNRFLRSETYRDSLASAKKKVFSSKLLIQASHFLFFITKKISCLYLNIIGSLAMLLIFYLKKYSRSFFRNNNERKKNPTPLFVNVMFFAIFE